MPKNIKKQYISAFKFLFKFIKPHKKWYLTAVITSILIIFINLLQTYVTGLLVNSSQSGNASKIVLSIIMFIFIISINIILTYTSGRSCAKLWSLSGRDLKRYISDKLLSAKYDEIIKQKSGDVLNTINSDTGNVCNFIGSDFIDLFSQFGMALASLIYLLTVNPILCLSTFAYTPIGMYFTSMLNRKMNNLYPQNADFKGEALSVVEQALSCIPIIKSFMIEKYIVKCVKRQFDNVYETDMKIAFYNAFMQPACHTTSWIPRVVYLILGGYMVINGSLTVGTFVAVFSLINYIIGPSVYFPFMLNRLNKTVASINRIKQLESLIQDNLNILSIKAKDKPSIYINNLCFGYSDNNPIINNFSFKHLGYGIVALCGSSGCGKTTLLDLIAGLHLPQSGNIQVSGSMGVVSQDSYLFSMSIMENIRLANLKATDSEVIWAAKLAGADNYINALSNGYNTIVGDGNGDLSGGQKQRISLARTILKNANIWLLDEPTSALDIETENVILDTIKKAAKQKLIIIAAHRKSLINHADIIINLEGANL